MCIRDSIPAVTVRHANSREQLPVFTAPKRLAGTKHPSRGGPMLVVYRASVCHNATDRRKGLAHILPGNLKRADPDGSVWVDGQWWIGTLCHSANSQHKKACGKRPPVCQDSGKHTPALGR